MRAVGIDLGTTSSTIAVYENGRCRVVPNAEGDDITPSVVAFGKNGEVLVGEPARRQAITNPERTIRSVKRHMGTDWRIEIDGTTYTAPQISARILRKLKRDAESRLGGPVDRAVVTVPAYFDDAQRTATREAGRIAGLDVLRIVNEPTAAALAFGFADEAEHTVVVFHLGGGTFDVSILEVGDGVFEVKATHGDTRLGGDDWDQRVVDWLVDRFRSAHGVDLSADPSTLPRLAQEVEDAKRDLSVVRTKPIVLPYLAATDDGPLHLHQELSRARFEELTADLLERCKGPFARAMEDAGLTNEQIDHVILVGGPTRMPAVQRLARELTGREPLSRRKDIVAQGAARLAGVLQGQVDDVLLLDVIPLSLGIRTKGGMMSRLVDRNTLIPTERTRVLSTGDDLQAVIEIEVLQGERDTADLNHSLGRLRFADLPSAPRGVPQIEVTFDIDANGIVHVTAKNRATGEERSLRATGHRPAR